jgi:class 3 adenylate cyclase
MEPRIQYAQTEDGVSIAYWTLGEGMPLVNMVLGGFSHIQLEWEIPQFRQAYERLARNVMLVRYDSRGSGLSDRDVTDYSLEAHLLDLGAVVDRLGSERFALLPVGAPGPMAIAYAVRHPERVSHLVLWCTYARASDVWASPQVKGLFGLLDTDWKLATETAAHAVVGWSEGESSHKYAALMRESVTPDALRALAAATSEVDVTALLPEVRAPTLIVHRRQLPFPTMDAARQLASKIPDARLVLQEGDAMGIMSGDWEATGQTIDEFLGKGEEAKTGAVAPAAEDIHTILFTDVEGSTALTQRLGDAKAREVLREHERVVREALKSHGGSEVKALGDGFMTSFSSATKALECAIAMQRSFAAHNESAEEPIRVRIGLNAGEPIAEEHDLHGTAVNEAARITATAKGGEILASDVVRQLVKGKEFLFADRGDTTLKGFDEPVRLYEVRWREDG